MIYDRVFNVIGRAYTKCGFLSCTVSMLEVCSYAVQKVMVFALQKSLSKDSSCM